MPNPVQLFNKAEAFKARGDYLGALQFYKKAAQKKHALAQFELGAMYYDGVGVDRDFPTALQWFLAAAQQGNTESELNLGTMYSLGQGVDPDPEKSFQWYLRAATKNQVLGEFRVGLMLYEGMGVKQDYATAFQYLYKAAKKGDARAQFNIGVMYFKGEGVSQSYSEAFRYYRLASDQNHVEATHNTALMFEEGLCTPPNRDEACRYYRKAAELGLTKSQYNLARLHHIDHDFDEALYWYHTAVERGHAPAMCALGDMYQHGQGVETSQKKAVRWYRRAAAIGNVDALDELQRMSVEADPKMQHATGNMFASMRQYSTAAHWYRKASDQNYPRAQYNLAVLLDRGLGCEQDKAEAARLFEEARRFDICPRAKCLD
jgi:TPR repeat protein